MKRLVASRSLRRTAMPPRRTSTIELRAWIGKYLTQWLYTSRSTRSSWPSEAPPRAVVPTRLRSAAAFAAPL